MAAQSNPESGGCGKRKMLEAHLREEVTRGHNYFKSRKIAADIDLSSKEIGALICQLQESDSDLSISKWGYSGGTTWYIE